MADEPKAPADLKTYVNDMHGLHRHIHQALSHQLSDERVQHESPVLDIIQKLHAFYGRHTELVEGHVKRLGAEVGKEIKESVMTALGVAAGLYGKVRKDPVSRMLRDDHTASSLASISLTMLQTTGLAFRDQQVAAYAEGALKELNPLIMRITDVIPAVVARELKEDNPEVDVAVSVQPVRTAREAWDQPPASH